MGQPSGWVGGPYLHKQRQEITSELPDLPVALTELIVNRLPGHKLRLTRRDTVKALGMSMPLQIRSYLLKCSQMAVLCFGALDCPGRP